jgi:Mce-associated membrane protein
MTTDTDNSVEVSSPEKDDTEPATESRASRTIALSVRSLLSALGAAAAAAAIITFALLWWSAREDLDALHRQSADNAHAEQVATDYAVGASTINYQDFSAWAAKLKAGTTPELGAKFDATAPKLQQILTPLKWTSTAAPIAAKVDSHSGGIYKVDVFVDVNSTSAQTPDGARTTVTYTVTVDSADGWKISDVGGRNGALPLN